MSEARAKAPRRQIRRAVGPEVVEVVKRHGTELELHKANIVSLSNKLQGLTNEHRADTAEVWTEVRGLVATSEPWRRGTVAGRMRWLLTGK